MLRTKEKEPHLLILKCLSEKQEIGESSLGSTTMVLLPILLMLGRTLLLHWKSARAWVCPSLRALLISVATVACLSQPEGELHPHPHCSWNPATAGGAHAGPTYGKSLDFQEDFN